MQSRRIHTQSSNNSGVPPVLSAVITSNQPDSGLDPSDRSPDWATPVIDSNGVITFSLRGEVFKKAQRVYTVKVTATDQAGNARNKVLKFTVTK